jgi:DNA primase
MEKRRYSKFAQRIDVEAWEEAIGFEVKFEKTNGRGEVEHIGHCLDPWGMHKNGDTSGKLAINPETKLFNCWVCGGGSLLSYTMAVKDMCEEDAIDWLFQFTASFEETDEDFLSDIEGILFEERLAKPTLPWFNENVLLAWQSREGLQEYMDERGISDSVAADYRLGYDPVHTRRSSKGDHCGPAVVFPHFWQGRLVGWQERWLGDRPKHIPKYTNTHDFPRDSSIYGYEQVYLAPDPIIIVESVPTVLFLASHGYPAVATFGSSVSDEQKRLLRLCQQGVILAPDNDAPGKKWLNDLQTYLERYVPVKVIETVPGEGADLGDLVGEKTVLDYLVQTASEHVI